MLPPLGKKKKFMVKFGIQIRVCQFSHLLKVCIAEYFKEKFNHSSFYNMQMASQHI